MDRGTRAFWLLIAALLGTSGYFACNVEAQRADARKAAAAAAAAASGSSE